MAILREQINTSLPLEEAFAFVGDFANAAQWDPGVASSERTNAGPVGVGARYHLLVRVGGRLAPMDYEVTAYEPGALVVLHGSGSGVEAVDEIRFGAVPGGTQVEYMADIRLRGLLRLATPFAGGAFQRVAREAREGMHRALEQRAAGAMGAV